MASPSAKRIIALSAGGIVYFALAVWGWGSVGSFFAQPAFITLTVVFAVVIVFAYFAGGNISAGQREDRGNRWVLAAFGILGLMAAYLPAYTDRIGFWVIDGEATRWTGIVLFAVGSALRLWPVYVLGDRFSGLVAIQPGHQLVTHGIYRTIRNPSYLGLLVGSLGWTLVFRSVIGILLTLLMIVPLVARMQAEERLLHSEFGADYDRYRARTWRLVPGIY